MKKTLSTMTLVLVCLFACVTTISAASGSSYPKTNLKHSWDTRWTITGDATYSELAGYGNQKRAYARMGSDGTWSSWVGSSAYKANVMDFGPWGGSYSASYSYK